MGAILLALASGLLTPGNGLDAPLYQDPSIATETVTIERQLDDQAWPPVTIDELSPQTVLTINAIDFARDSTGEVLQCVHLATRLCSNRLPVRFDEEGRATFQYLVSDEIAEAVGERDPCRLGGARCTLELAVAGYTAVVDTVFVDTAPPPGRLTVAPDHDLEIDQMVTLTVDGLAAGTEVTVLVCAGSTIRTSRCGAPGPVVPMTVGTNGRAEARVELDVSEVGSERVACGRQVGCRAVVTSDQVGVRVDPVTLSFQQTAGADYSPRRLLPGVGVGVALIIAALGLVRSTDWSPPREADAASIDEAEYADLDLEAALVGEWPEDSGPPADRGAKRSGPSRS